LAIAPRECVKTRITDLDGLKHCIRTEWVKLDHAIIAAAVRQWHRRSFSLCEGGSSSFRALLLILTFEQLSVDIFQSDFLAVVSYDVVRFNT